MRLVEHFARTGDVLFRWRSYLPLVLLPVFVASFVGFRYPYDSHAFDLAWEISCFVLSMAGLAVRVFVVGTAPRGTSGRNTRRQKAQVLNTTGPYSLVRHPLYLGNYLAALGLSFVSRTWFLPIIVSLASLLYYERIAAREEEYLEARFGDEFRDWAARVPALIPSFRHYRPPALPFDWRKALGREFYAFFGIVAGFFVLELIGEFAVSGRIELDPVWTAVFVLSATFFAAMWALKKTGRLKVQDDLPAELLERQNR